MRRKGDIQWISLIFATTITMLLLLLLAPFISEIEFKSNLNTIQKESVKQFRSHAVTAAFLSNPKIVERTKNYSNLKKELERLRSKRNSLRQKVKRVKNHAKKGKSRVKRLKKINEEMRKGGPGGKTIPELEDEASKIVEKLQESSSASDSFFEKIKRIDKLNQRVRELGRKKSKFESDIESFMIEQSQSYRIELKRKGENSRILFEQENGLANLDFSRVKMASPDEKPHVISIAVAEN
ncbi:MAG: hypothetical protein ABEJ56_06790 [Candidatus Nanohaloarchaea archaeon]